KMEELIQKKLEEILGHLRVSPKVSLTKEDDIYNVVLDGDDLSFLIGFRGESLNALQTLLATFVFNEHGEWPHLVVDINGYRDSRREKIEEMDKGFIDRVRFHNSAVELPTMNSFERRLVHTFISEYPDIMSESVGEGRNRRVVLKMKGSASE